MMEAAFIMQVADIPALVEIAELIHQQLREVGVSVSVEPQPLLSWFTNLRRGAFEATLISHLPYESPDIPTRFFHSLGPDATASPFGFHDAAIDALIERSWGEEDRARRRETLLEAQRLMVKARPIIGLFTNVGYSAAWKQVQNLRPGLPGSLAQYNYEQWLLEDAD
jgi:ABC-type transport system substrate-binding protein